MALVDGSHNNFNIFAAPDELTATPRASRTSSKSKTPLRDLSVSEVQNSQHKISSASSISVDDLAVDLQKLQIHSPCKVTKLDRKTKRSEPSNHHKLETVPEHGQQIGPQSKSAGDLSKRQHYIELPGEGARN